MNQDYIDIFRALFAAEARFMVVGAFALAVHAEPRATGDIDIWIDSTPDNAQKTYEALKAFGAPLDELTVADLHSPDVVFQMGRPPSRINILTFITGVRFEEAWQRKTSFKLSNLEIPVISKEDLITNKKAVGRPKDLFDLELLNKK